ncbi:MAG: hypothetical protein GXP62_09530 [Oligoflexia bacterium]|nr:hypothetical protein [Oligoflexia bacterium]
MPATRLWIPTLRCMRCRALKPADALRAWLFQPPALDGGSTLFVCRACRVARGEPQRW